MQSYSRGKTEETFHLDLRLPSYEGLKFSANGSARAFARGSSHWLDLRSLVARKLWGLEEIDKRKVCFILNAKYDPTVSTPNPRTSSGEKRHN